MGVTLSLVSVDHTLIVERGLPIVDQALAADDSSILRNYLRTLPIVSSEDLTKYHQARVTRLKQVGAPPFIISHEERASAEVSEQGLSKLIESGSFDQLRDVLGSWGWRLRTFHLDKAFEGVHWYCDPKLRARQASSPAMAEGMLENTNWLSNPSLTPTLLDFAFVGEEAYPRDSSGAPIIRTRGTPGDDTSRYNGPERVKLISGALDTIDMEEAWDGLLPERIQALSKQNQSGEGSANSDPDPSANLKGIEDWARQELEYLRHSFPKVVEAYLKSAEKGFGVSVEYTL